MLIIPAIDLYENQVVRLHQGDYADVTRYGSDPSDVARSFADAGARRIHLVDLSAARGNGSNSDAIRRIRAAVSCELEAGGGIRDFARARELVEEGIDYIVVGTIFARSPEAVEEWAEELGSRIIAGIDARDGIVRVSGWEESAGVTAVNLAKVAAEIGIAAIEYTNIARDGAFAGPDLAGTAEIARVSAPLPVIASGGVRDAADITAAASIREIAGVIVGRAIYEGRLDLADVVARYDGGGTR